MGPWWGSGARHKAYKGFDGLVSHNFLESIYGGEEDDDDDEEEEEEEEEFPAPKPKRGRPKKGDKAKPSAKKVKK